MTTPPPTAPLDRHDDHDDHDDEGLAVDLPLLLRSARVPAPPARADTVVLEPTQRPWEALGRRQFLRFAGGAGAVAVLAACGSSRSATNSTTSTSTSTSSTGTAAAPTTVEASTAATTATSAASGAVATAGTAIPDETAGPYPGDGTNGPNALTESGVVRPDIRSSFGSSSGVADGIVTEVRFTVVDADTGAPLSGAAVYLWHATQGGEYSLYDIPDENYLRGVQVADDAGIVAFTSVFPGCYAGRWPHAHFEVYTSIDEATVGSQAIKTSQLAYPEASCVEAYGTTGYEASVRNLSGVSLDTDNVFRDGYADQLGTVTGSPADGYAISLVVRV